MIDTETLIAKGPHFLAGFGAASLFLGGILIKTGLLKKSNGSAHQHPDIVLKDDCDKHHQALEKLLDAKLEAGNARMQGIEDVGKANNEYLKLLSQRRRNDRTPQKDSA